MDRDECTYATRDLKLRYVSNEIKLSGRHHSVDIPSARSDPNHFGHLTWRYCEFIASVVASTGKRCNDASLLSKEEYEVAMISHSSADGSIFGVSTPNVVFNSRRTPFGGGQEKASTPSDSATFPPMWSTPFGGTPDYHAIMVTFYQKHNTAKVADVTIFLEKYKGEEIELFQRMAAKYKVKNPLDEIQSTGAPTTTPIFGSAITATSPFGAATAPTSTAAAFPFPSSGGPSRITYG